MAKKRKRKRKSSGPPRRPSRQPKKQAYPSPAERERIIRRRDELLQKLLPLLFQEAGDRQQHSLTRLAQKYGVQEVTTVMNAFQYSTASREFIGEESQLYRIYRLTFAHFGGDRRFLNKQDYEKLVAEHARLIAKGRLLPLIRRRPSQRERDLYDLTLVGVYFWEDVTPPAVPPTPVDFEAPDPGHYGYPARDLLAWGWNLDEERFAQTLRNKAKWRSTIPDLIRMVFDEGLLSGWPGKAPSWASYHALHMLGHLRAHEHAGQLLALMDREDDWMSDRLPLVWGQMGPKAEAPLWAYLDNRDHHPDKRALMLMGLEAIAETHPRRRQEIVEELIYRLQKAPADDGEVNAYTVFVLDRMEAVEAREAITDAFEQDRIDTSIIQEYDLPMLYDW